MNPCTYCGQPGAFLLSVALGLDGQTCRTCAVQAFLRAIDLTLTRQPRALDGYPVAKALLPVGFVELGDGYTTLKVGVRSGRVSVILERWSSEVHERVRQQGYLPQYLEQLRHLLQLAAFPTQTKETKPCTPPPDPDSSSSKPS